MSRVFRSLSRSSSSISLGSNSVSSSSSSPKNKEIVTIENVEKHLNNWDIPKVGVSSVYNKDTFVFKSDYIIKTVEEALPITGEVMEVPLISKKFVETYREKYSYLHFGLVQVAIKPLTREGLNNSVLTCIRDKRHRSFTDSLLGCVESTLSEGPIYFNCFPNFTVHLHDNNVIKSLMVDLKTCGFDMEEGTSNLALIYRVYCKVMNTISPDINIKSLIRDKKGETTLFQTNLAKSKLAVPKRVPWKEITFPETWFLEKATTIPIKQNTQLNQIVEDDDGSVVIRFDDHRSVKMLPGRYSDVTSQICSPFYTEPSRRSESRLGRQAIGSQENPEGVSIPVYQPASLTPSDIGYSNICVLEKTNVSIECLNKCLIMEITRRLGNGSAHLIQMSKRVFSTKTTISLFLFIK